jgi:hypothetical protein
MGFIARSIFWLGLVYSAMPLDFGSLISAPAPNLADANPLAACAQGAPEDCRRRVEDLRKALTAAAALGVVDLVAAASESSGAKDKAPPRKPPQSRAN